MLRYLPGILYTRRVPTLQIVYASTSGHTEYVVGLVTEALKNEAPGVTVSLTRAELAVPETFLAGDFLLLASGTWNTGGSEGQLNPHMHALLLDRAKGADLRGKKAFVIGLGDARYHFTARAHDRLIDFVKTHNGVVLEPTLKIVNEPYGQEESVRHWVKHLLSSLPS